MENKSVPPIVGVIFSKDRAMQLDAVLHSFQLHCQDIDIIDLKVLYLTTTPFYQTQYEELMQEYESIQWIKEVDFKDQLQSLIKPYPHVLFLVDDNLFTRDFSLQKITESLTVHSESIGFSLRLGKNTHYCYPANAEQKIADFTEIEHGFLRYDWTAAEYDFGYPLEVSSSVYRVDDISPLITQLPFTNPNLLEAKMAEQAAQFSNNLRFIICDQYSIAFCNPLNKVQDVFNNRAGQQRAYTAQGLAELFAKGYRIDVDRYRGFMPEGCHQEVELQLRQTT